MRATPWVHPEAMTRTVRLHHLVLRHPLVAFVVLAYGLSWSYWLVAAFVPGGPWSHVPGLIGPGVAAVVVTALRDGRAGLHTLGGKLVRLSFRDRLAWLGLATPLLFAAVAVPAERVASGAWPEWSDFGRFGGLPALGVVTTWLLLVLIGGVGEETGWRGFAVPVERANHDPLATSLVVGSIWAGWHLPMFVLPTTAFHGLDRAVLPAFILGLLAGSVVLTWLVGRSGSVLAVAIWHGTYNLVAGSEAGSGVMAATETSLVMVMAAVLIAAELRARRRGGRSVFVPAP